MDILLVDDSRVMRQLVRRTLRQAGYDVGQVIEAENGQDALDKLSSYNPDLVLSDWNMPVMNGIELLAALRERGNKVSFGFITSESTPSMRARATTTGALFLLTKPFGAEDMRHVMTAAGLKPAGKVVAHDVAPVASVATKFDAKTLTKLFEQLVHVPVTIKPGPKIVPAATPCVSCTWVDAENAIRYVGFCEFPLAASLGAALGLRPATWVTEQLKSKAVHESLHADSREVFNVLSRLFNDCGSIHVRLNEISFPPAPALPAARTFDSRAASRMDMMVTIQGYASGKLSLVSGSAPEFITTR
ncbi:MAG: response regulator [Myxococcota bacterium]